MECNLMTVKNARIKKTNVTDCCLTVWLVLILVKTIANLASSWASHVWLKQ